MWSRLNHRERFGVIFAATISVVALIQVPQHILQDLLVLSGLVFVPAAVILTLRRSAVAGLGIPAAVLGAVAFLRHDDAELCFAVWFIATICALLALVARASFRRLTEPRRAGQGSGLVGVAVRNPAPEVRASDILAQLGLNDGRME